MAKPVLSVQNLHINYRVTSHSFEALHDVSLDVWAGGVHGILGESGCGKSTLASAMIGLLPPNGSVTSGQVVLNGRTITGESERNMRRIRGREIGMIFQDPLTSLNPTFTIGAQMINAQQAHPDRPISKAAARTAAIEMLGRVGIPAPERRVDDYPHQFSGGQRQRIMIATALLLKPSVLVCDEATSALDVTLQAQILTLLKQLSKEEGNALVVISHDIGVIAEMSDDVSVLYAGRTLESGPADAVLSNPQHPYTRKLLASVPSRHRRTGELMTIPGRVPSLADLPEGCTFADRCEAAQPACRASEPPLIEIRGQLMRCLPEIRDAAGPDPAQPTPPPPQQSPSAADVPAEAPAPESPAAPLIDVRSLHVHFGQKRRARANGADAHVVRAVDGIDLEIGRGEIIGLVGESGSGKTTLGKALLRLAPITSGSIEFDGVDLATVHPRKWRQLRRNIQMVFQEPQGSLSPRMRVHRLITEPYEINNTPEAERYTPDELLALVGLSSEQNSKYPHELSGGQARRVGIARALAMHPSFIVADEPTSGLDVSAAAAILNLLRDLRSRLELTQLIITHDLNIVGFIADRIAVMHQGEIVEIGTADEILDAPQHPYTRELLSSVPSLAGVGAG